MALVRHAGTRLLAAALAVALIVILGSASDALAATKVTITGDTAAAENDAGGWMFNRDQSTKTPYEFTLDESRIGTGSLYVPPIGSSASDKFIAEYFLRAPVGEVESISFDFLVGDNADPVADADQFYMNVYVNFDDSDNFYDCRYNIVAAPTSGDWSTVTFDRSENYPVTPRPAGTDCPSSPAGLPPGSHIRVVALNLGDTSANDAGVDGYFDNVVVETAGGTTVFDFEAAPTSRDDCKNGGWADYGFRNQGQCIRFVNTGEDSR